MRARFIPMGDEMRALILHFVFASLALAPGAARAGPGKIPAACVSPELSKKLGALKDSWFNETLNLKTLNTFTGKLAELNNSYPQVADKSCRNIKGSVSDDFRRFHLKVMETTAANAMLRSCAKGRALQERKVDSIIRRIAKLNDLNVCSPEKQAALDELDLYSKIIDKQQGIHTGGYIDVGIVPDSRVSMSALRQQVYHTSVEARQDSFSPSVVHAGNPALIRQIGESRAQAREAQVKDVALHSNQGADATESYIKAKFGFDLYNSDYVAGDKNYKKRPEARQRAVKLHLAMMDGNRVNSLRNYLYFTQRFSFVDPEKKAPVESTVKRFFGTDFGKEAGTVPGMSRNYGQLVQVGKDTLAEFRKNYKDAPVLDEGTVLAMLEPAIEIRGEQRRAEAGSKMGHGMYLTQEELAIHNRLKSNAAAMSEQKKIELMEAVRKTEVGFLIGTKALDKIYRLDYRLPQEELLKQKKELVREALKERIGEAEKYAKWVRDHQDATDKNLDDFADDGELMLYSSPVVSQAVIQKEPQLMASMCAPLKTSAENSKGRKSEMAEIAEYGGGAMMVAGGPFGAVAGTTMGLVASGIKIYDNARRAAILEKNAEFAGKGESILNQDAQTEAAQDRQVLTAEAKQAREQAWDEALGSAMNIGMGIAGGYVLKEVALGYKAYREAKAAGKILNEADELARAKKYFDFETQIKNATTAAKKAELVAKEKAWKQFLGDMEKKLGRKLEPNEVDELMIGGNRAHEAGQVRKVADQKGATDGKGTAEQPKLEADLDKKRALVKYRQELEEKYVKSGMSRKDAHQKASQTLKVGTDEKVLLFGNVENKLETVDDLKNFVPREFSSYKTQLAGKSEKEVLEFLTGEFDDFAARYRSAQTQLEKLPTKEMLPVKKELDQQLSNFKTWFGNRLPKGEDDAIALMKTRGIEPKRSGWQVTSAPVGTPPVATYSKTLEESLETMAGYRKRFDPQEVAETNRQLHMSAPSTQVRETVAKRLAEQKDALKEVQDIKKAYGSQFDASPAPGARNANVELASRERQLQQSIDELTKTQNDLVSTIRNKAKKIEDLHISDTRDYVLKSSLGKFKETGAKDPYFINKVKDDYKQITRDRANFTDQDVPGLHGPEVDAHLQRLEKYLKEVGESL